jgi:hypothetical protein
MSDEPQLIADALTRLRRAGWSVGDTAFHAEGDGLVWLVTGHNGENQIEGRGATAAEAWRSALEQARLLGMLGRVRAARGDGGVGEGR